MTYAALQTWAQSVEKAGTFETEAVAEALRSHEFDTVLGRVGFDANGDSTQQIVTLYRVDPSAAGGAGDWVVVQQRDFAEEE